MDIKQLGVPIKDFDTGGYDEVEFISKEDDSIQDAVEAKPEYRSIQDIVSSDIESSNVDVPLVDGLRLFEYFKNRFKEAHGYEYPSDAGNEIAIFDDFKNRYGENAGPMVKILFDKHQGKLSAVNGVITINAFKRGAKWIQDMLYCELQEDKKRSKVDNSTEGLMSSHDFIKFFSVAD